MADIEWLRKYEEAEAELRDYISQFFGRTEGHGTPTTIDPPSPEEIAEMARLRQVADEAWASFMASSTPGER